jgi:Cof subfamily protein (haloacid dehalogenase superfamily)
MYKLIATDMDGTLFNEKSIISPYSREVLRAAHQKGYKIVIATGRHHDDARRIVEDGLGIDAYKISANGASIYTPNDIRIAYNPIEEDLVCKLTSLKTPAEVYIHLYMGDKWYCDKDDVDSRIHQAMSGFMYDVVDYKTFDSFHDCTKMCFIARDAEGIEYMERTVEEMKDPRLSFFFTMARCFEAMDHKADKALALSEILKVENIDASEVVAFGDGMNDLNMLKLAGKGLVMGNAVEELKNSLPGNQIIGLNSQDSVARYIETHLL